jgi:predicted O-linked N-acetylglucosamine transferase (SPINDLY family)
LAQRDRAGEDGTGSARSQRALKITGESTVSNPDKDRAQAALREARSAWERGDAARAESYCRDALNADDEDARAWILLGMVLRRRDPAAAHAALTAAIERDPGHPDAWFHLGNLHREQRRYADAIAAYETAVITAPDNASLHNNLGLALEGAGYPERAEAAYRTALARVPGHRQSLGNLAHLLCRLRRYAEAESLCEEYLRRFADADAVVWVDRGICRHHARDYDSALASFERARILAPDDVIVLSNLGSVLVDRRDYERAEKVLAQATALEASLLYPSSLLAYCQAQLCAWTNLEVRHESIRRELEAGSDQPINAFAALSIPLSPAMQLRVARRWARDLAPPSPPALAAPAMRRSGALRVGYLSSDFRTHATSSLLAEVWERHDRTRLTTYAYSIGPHESSSLRLRIEAAFDRFVDCSDDSTEQTARRIAEDGIEVLIDLNGYTANARSEILAFRPAPVQINWLGYLGTLGADWYDYILTDRFVCPAAQQPLFSERFLYLPDCYCPSDTRRPVAAPPDRAACGLPEQGFVFCCFNSPHKILPAMFDVWMRLLREIPDSVLWLAPDSAPATTNLRREALARAVEPHRLVPAASVPLPEHLARHVHADLFLDTAPHNAGTVANDALFMGVPVVTCAGETMAGRVAGSQLMAIGLPDLVTTSIDTYEALALALARDPLRLREYRERLRTNRVTQPLFDMARFTSALDDRLCAAWEDRASATRPRPRAEAR